MNASPPIPLKSAKEDAQSPAPVTTTTRRADGASHAWLPWLAAFAGAAAAWLALLTPAFLPSVPRFACRVTHGAGRGFEMTGPSSEVTLERALGLAGSAQPTVEAARSRLSARAAEWRLASVGPLSQLAPAAECAALLRARAELARTLSGPLTPNVSSDEPEGAPLSNELADADSRVERAALLGDPPALRTALHEAEGAEDRWLVAIQPDPRRRFAVWLARELDRSSQFRIAAEDLEALQTTYQRELIQQWLPQFMLELKSGALSTLNSMPAPGRISPVRPRVWVWAFGAMLGALAGAMLARLARAGLKAARQNAGTDRGATGASRPSMSQRNRSALPAPAGMALPFLPVEPPGRRQFAPADVASARMTEPAETTAARSSALEPASAEAPAAPAARLPAAPSAPAVAHALDAAAVAHALGEAAATHRGHDERVVAPGPMLAAAVGDAWLHLVSAEDTSRVARAAGELAVPLLSRGRRVLLIDAGHRLKLHESFGGAPRWGVGECLSGELPLLGTVQRAGVRDLYLLAAGSYPGRGSYAELGVLVDEARRHFSSVVVALDARVPAEARSLVEGRHVEAWWPQRSGRLPRVALAFGERIGVPITSFGLAPRSEHWLEALEGRVETLRAVLNPPRPDALEPLPGETAPHRRQVSSARATGPRTAASPAPARDRTAASGHMDDPNSPTVYRRADEDERARERLRFLLWMRQVRAERSKRQMTPVS